MKRSLLLSLIVIGPCLLTKGQNWCTPATAVPYNANMPGITNFQCNTISRASADLETYPNNSYVNTGLSTSLSAGSTYTVTIGYTIDASICPDMNLRVWIDYNQDGQLDDIGETVISANNQTALTYTGTFTVPANATPGLTRMRVTAKMTSNGGHSLPSPCDNPVDPLGYHGEFEDYDVTIVATGLPDIYQSVKNFSLFPNPSAGDFSMSVSMKETQKATIMICDISGKVIKEIRNENLKPGVNKINFSPRDLSLAPGIYFVGLEVSGEKKFKKLVFTGE